MKKNDNTPIVIRLHAGFGNQLFQYALGYALSKRSGLPFALDISSFETYTLRGYELDKLSISAPKISNEDATDIRNNFYRSRIAKYLNRNMQKFLNPFSRSYVVESEQSFHPQVLEIKHPCYIEGYWQSEKYFYEYRNELLAQFAPRSEPGEYQRSLISEIRTTESVAIFVRRGDCVSIPEYFDLCTEKYRIGAVEIMHNLLQKPRFYIFSDDIEWCKQNFDFLENKVFIDQELDDAVQNMELASNCKHFIIANSTFAWWAAWKSTHPSKVVIAPKNWISGPRPRPDTIPAGWIQLDPNGER